MGFQLRMPFQKLMELVEEFRNDPDEDPNTSLGVLSRRWSQPPERIMDAIDAVRFKNGEQTYVTIDVDN